MSDIIQGSHVKIGLGPHAFPEESFVELDGKRLSRVRSVSIHARVGETTTVNIEFIPFQVEIEGQPGILTIDNQKPKNLIEAIAVLGEIRLTPVLNADEKVCAVKAEIDGVHSVRRFDDVVIDKPLETIGEDTGTVIQSLIYKAMDADYLRKYDGSEWQYRNRAFVRITPALEIEEEGDKTDD